MLEKHVATAMLGSGPADQGSIARTNSSPARALLQFAQGRVKHCSDFMAEVENQLVSQRTPGSGSMAIYNLAVLASLLDGGRKSKVGRAPHGG